MVNIDPVKKLDFKSDTGTTGKLDNVDAEAWRVPYEPTIMSIIERTTAAIGPLRAKSSRAALLEGKDLSGVMHPKVPTWVEGSGSGGPILIPRIFATV